MEYRVEPELLQPTPRPIQPKMSPAQTGCLGLLLSPFVAIGIYQAIGLLRAIGEALHPDPSNHSTGAWGGVIFAAVFALGWNGMLIYAATYSMKKARKDSLLVREGTAVPATILESSPNPHLTSPANANAEKEQWFYRYQFVRVSGARETIVSTQTVNRDSDGTIKVGDTVTALYLPEEPSQNALYPFCGYRVKGASNTEFAHGTQEDPSPTFLEAPSEHPAKYRMEPELNQHLPRAIEPFDRWLKGASGCYMLFMTPFVLYCLWDLYQSLSVTAVNRFGTTAEAIVESKAEGRRFLSKGENGPDTHLYVTYRFQANGATYHSQDDVFENDYKRIQPGDRISIRYLPLAPSRLTLLSERSGNDAQNIGDLLFPITMVSVFIYIPLILRAQGRRFVRRGIAVPATITSKTVDTSGSSDVYYLHFKFFVQGSPSLQQGKQIVQRAQWEEASVGETLTLLYLPNSPQNYRLYRYSFFKARLR